MLHRSGVERLIRRFQMLISMSGWHALSGCLFQAALGVPSNLSFTHDEIVRPIMRLRTSLIPIGLTPGHLSNATRRQFLYSTRDIVGIFSVAFLLAMVAMVLLRFVESFSNDDSKHLH